MPIHSAGYRAWEGERVPGATRWLVISGTGVRRAWKSTALKRMMYVAVLPTLFMAIPFFLFEQAARDPRMWRVAVDFLRWLPQTEAIVESIGADLTQVSPQEIHEIRHRVWSYLLLTLFRYPQSILMVLVVGIIAPPLISHDVRSRAFLIYFSRPITRTEYILGKMGSVAFFLLMIATVPALLLYVAGVMLSPSTTVIAETWDLPFRILLASAVLIVPTTSLALMYSSLTVESRYAGFAWFVTWILGHVTFFMTFTFSELQHGPRYAGEVVDLGWKPLLSPYMILGEVQNWIFELHRGSGLVGPSFVILAGVTVVSLMVIYRRVSAPMRA